MIKDGFFLSIPGGVWLISCNQLYVHTPDASTPECAQADRQ